MESARPSRTPAVGPPCRSAIRLVCAACAAVLIQATDARAQGVSAGAVVSPWTLTTDPADTTRLVIPRVPVTAAADGRLPRTAWDAIPSFPMTEPSPRNGAEPSERTEIRIAHDGLYVCFSARMYDREPQGIQAPSLKRDEIPETGIPVWMTWPGATRWYTVPS